MINKKIIWKRERESGREERKKTSDYKKIVEQSLLFE